MTKQPWTEFICDNCGKSDKVKVGNRGKKGKSDANRQFRDKGWVITWANQKQFCSRVCYRAHNVQD